MRRTLAVMAASLLLAGAAAPPPVMLSGAVAHPGPWTLAALAALKQTETTVLDAHQPGQTRKYAGPLLLDVLDFAGIVDVPGRSTHLRHVIMARGADGYTVAVAIGEIDPKLEGKDVLIALTEDGYALPAPMLIVPHDHHAARRVHQLVALEVQ